MRPQNRHPQSETANEQGHFSGVDLWVSLGEIGGEQGSRSINFIYDAGGNKLRKTVVQSGSTQYSQDYVGGIEYRTDASNVTTLEAIYHAEGRIMTISSTLKYEYAFKDHLGNTRLMFCDKNSDGIVTPSGVPEASEVTQENHYYAFGMQMESVWYNTPSVSDNKYQYNGKEYNDDFGLNWNDYGARFYDAALAKWHSFDPKAEKMQDYSPYNYVFNNPMRFIDPDGMAPEWKPEIHVDKDENGKATNAYLVLKAEAGDNAETLAKSLGISQSQADGIYANFDAKTGEVALPTSLNGVESIDDAAHTAIVGSPENYGGFLDRNYNCYQSAVSISQNETIPKTEEMDKSTYINIMNNDYKETKSPSIGTVTSFKDNPLLGQPTTPHAATYLAKDSQGTNYYWSKNGDSSAPKIATEKELHKNYSTSTVKYFNKS